MDIVSQVSNQDSLVKLVQKGNEIGSVFTRAKPTSWARIRDLLKSEKS